MLNREQISKLTNAEIVKYLEKPHRAYDEDILYIAEGLQRLLSGKNKREETPQVESEVLPAPEKKRGRKPKEEPLESDV